jgi:hypothetical protein
MSGHAIEVKPISSRLPKAASYSQTTLFVIDILRMVPIGVNLFSIVTGIVVTLAVLIPTHHWLLPRQRIKERDAFICSAMSSVFLTQ